MRHGCLASSKQHNKLLCRDSQRLACCLLARSKGGSGTYFVIQDFIYPSAHLGRIGPLELVLSQTKHTCAQFLYALFVRPSAHQGRTGPDTGFVVCLSVCHVRPSVSLMRVCVVLCATGQACYTCVCDNPSVRLFRPDRTVICSHLLLQAVQRDRGSVCSSSPVPCPHRYHCPHR